MVKTIPTIGFNVENVDHKNVHLQMWDVGMRDAARALLRHYLPGTSAIVCVVDSRDRERLPQVRDLLASLVREDELRDAVFLLYANKQDLENAAPPEEVTTALDLSAVLHGHPWRLFGASATEGAGLNEGLDWLADTLAASKAKRQLEDGVLGSVLRQFRALFS